MPAKKSVKKKTTRKKSVSKKKPATKKTSKKNSVSKKTNKKPVSSKTKNKVSNKNISKKTKGIGSAKITSRYYNQKFNLVLRNLVLFVILFISSLVLYNISLQEFYQNLFSLFSFIFGFVSLGLIIVLLIFLFLRLFKDK